MAARKAARAAKFVSSFKLPATEDLLSGPRLSEKETTSGGPPLVALLGLSAAQDDQRGKPKREKKPSSTPKEAPPPSNGATVSDGAANDSTRGWGALQSTAPGSENSTPSSPGRTVDDDGLLRIDPIAAAEDAKKQKAAGAYTDAIRSGRRKPTAPDWHEIPVAKMTPELRRDLVLLENRASLDPKRFYKASGTGRKKGQLPERVHVGTVIEAPHEYLSGRLTRRQRKQSFADEIFSDKRIVGNARRRFAKIQEKGNNRWRTIDPAARKIRKQRRQKW